MQVEEVLESISDAFYSLDREWRFTYVNARALAVWRKSPKELLGNVIWDVFPTSRSTESFARMHAAMDDRRPAAFESYSTFLGTWISVNLYPTPRGLSVFFQDITERKRIEKALTENEQQFRATFELASVGMVQADPGTGHLLRVNTKFCAITGFTPDELVGRRFSDITHPDDRERDWEVFQDAVRGATPDYRSEKRYVRKDGSVVWVRVNAAILRDASGRPQRTVAVIEDVSERVLAEQALRESRSDLAHAQQVAHTGSWRLDLVRDKLSWSDECYRIFGIPVGTRLTYEEFLAAVHPDDRASVDRSWQAALRGEPYEIEHRIVVGEEVRWVRERAELEIDSRGSILGGFGTVQDITARKAAEHALRQSEHWWHELADAMPQLVWTAGPDGMVDYFNRRREEYVGLSRDENGSWRWEGALHPDDVQPTLEAWGEALATGEVYEITHRVRCLDGSHRWLLSRAVPLPDASGCVVKWFGTSTDIHEERLLQAQLAEARETLERRVRERTAELELARAHLLELSRRVIEVQEKERRAVARELHDEAGQSLTAIKVSLALIGREHGSDPALLDRLAELQDTVDEVMVRLHGLSMRLRPVALDRLGLERALAQLVEAVRAQGIELTFEFAGPCSGARLPMEIETSLYRIAQESLTNVRRHAAARKVSLAVHCGPEATSIEVRDDGVGFDVGSALRCGRLGLEGMIERVELLGGTIHIDSRTGAGTIIRAVLPLDGPRQQ
ncbi:MAG: PAS domain S-box protein [Acidobacteria bacterium]|nr:PAS domain S-box protein [Acidobacteriota bacterium]